MALSLEDMTVLGKFIKVDKIPPTAFTSLDKTLFSSGFKRSLNAFNDLGQIGSVAQALRDNSDKNVREVSKRLSDEMRKVFLG